MPIDEQIVSLMVQALKKTLAEVGNGHQPEKLLTIPEAALLLKVDKKTVYEWMREGRIKVINLGGAGGKSYRVHPTELDRFIRACPPAGSGEE